MSSEVGCARVLLVLIRYVNLIWFADN